MTMRSSVLFVHVLGMLALFGGLAIEWVFVELLQAHDQLQSPAVAATVLKRLPRSMGIAFGLILISGGYLASTTGTGRLPFVGMSLLGIVLMAAAGRILSPRASLRIRVCIVLGIVYLMVAKPDLIVAITAIAIAVVVGIAGNLVRRPSSVRTSSV